MERASCFAIVMALCLCLAGCGQTQPSPVQTAAPVRHIITPAPSSLEPSPEPGVLAAGKGDETKAQVVYSTAEETACWQVESWKIYASWAAAGVDTRELITSDADQGDMLLSQPGGGMLIVRMRYTNRTTYTNGTVFSYVDVHPSIDGESDGAEVVWFPERAQDVIDGGPWGTAFYIPAEGESVMLTLGWVLAPEEVEAARNGELSLGCDTGRNAPDQMTLLPLIPKGS